jgi:Fe-S-cluster containining protein
VSVSADRPLLFSDQVYDCVQCGKSCTKQWRILVDPVSKSTLESTEIYQTAYRQGVRPLQSVESPTGWHELRIVPNDEAKSSSCHFFHENLCLVHAQAGAAMKPRVCQQFPFLPIETPDGILIGLSFRCTAVQDNYGRSLEAHREQLKDLVSGAMYRTVGFGKILKNVSKSGEFFDWPDYLGFESNLLRIVWKSQSPELLFLRMLEFAENALVAHKETVTTPRFLPRLASLFASLEGGASTSEGRLAYDCWSQSENYLSPRFQIPVRPTDLTLKLAEPYSALHLRYLSHLLERKFLLLGEDIYSPLQDFLGYALAIHCLSYLFSPWTASHANYAVDLVEGEFVEHHSSASRTSSATKCNKP